MTELTDLTADHTTALIPTWQLSLRAEDKSPATIKTYTQGVRTYLTWCTAREAAPMTRISLNTWIAEMLDAGAAPGTARTRQLAMRRFTAWQIAVGRLDADPFLGIKGPPQRPPLITPLTDDELRALIATCTAPTHRPDEPLHHRRDEAIIRLMLETGIRAGELITLGADDVDLVAGLVTIRRALRRRAQRAGVKGFHPHQLRHTAAHRWLAHGGSESGLMAIAGWTRTDMLVRYTRAGHPSGQPKRPGS